MNLTVQLQGLDNLSLKVKYMTKAAAQGLKFGVNEAAGLFEEEAKLLVPVVTGNLRDHIHTEVLVNEPEHQQALVTPVTAASNPWGIDPAYARRIEFGFIGTDSLGRHFQPAAQPYMRPAFENKRDEARQAIKDNVYDALDEVMSKKR